MDTQFVSNKSLTFYCDLDLGCWNLNFVYNIPSHFALSFCEVWLKGYCTVFQHALKLLELTGINIT